jgi:uncharacterized CHY-type Zn-finger protein
MDVPSLRPPWTTSSVMYCTNCHGSDTGAGSGGIGPNGLHGSNNDQMLVANYDTRDYISESASTYALCYKCHDRTNILNDHSFKEHKKHIVDERTPCVACHDAHGISSTQGNATNNSNLINFSTQIVQPNSAGRLEFRDLGSFRGECSLRCHNKDHVSNRYGF